MKRLIRRRPSPAFVVASLALFLSLGGVSYGLATGSIERPIVFPNNGVYRELFSLYSTTEVLNDARRRQELVEFVRALLAAGDELKAKPQPHFPLVAKTIGQPADLVARAWEHHAFPYALPKDVLDVMEQEEAWVARNQKRAARTRATLAEFIDTTVLAEARKRPAQGRE